MPSELNVACSNCGENVNTTLDDEARSAQVTCGNCGTEVTVTHSPGAETEASASHEGNGNPDGNPSA